MTAARRIASMSTITGRALGALFLGALVAGAAPAEAGVRRECRRQCGAAVAACVSSTGQAARICKAQMRRRCRTEGLQVCAVTSPMTAPACNPTPSSISSGFNGTPITKGNFIWFNSVFKVSGLSATQTATIHFTGQTITGLPSGPVSVPDATVTFCPGCSPATTTFSGGMWVTSVPSSGLDGNVFLSGVAFQVPTNFPGGINPVTWRGNFSSSTPGLTIQWQWAAAVYTSFNAANYNADGVKPVDDPKASSYKNSNHA